MNSARAPAALDIAVHAVSQLEDNPLFNSGHGAVFTRDGVNELEASVMVSRGAAKRGVGVMGLRHVRNPVRLARQMLLHGEADLLSQGGGGGGGDLDVPSAQGHTQIYGQAAEQLARSYGLEMVDPQYFFTKPRWDEHVRALERERAGGRGVAATWSPDEYLPQGTCGAVAMDREGVICAATSTGGLTNKLTGRVGDTPVPGAGFWAEEWSDSGDAVTGQDFWDRIRSAMSTTGGPVIGITGSLRALLADCLPTPLLYTPLGGSADVVTTRSMGTSGTGNGDSFLRTSAMRTAAAIARWGQEPASRALARVAGPGGELQRSAGDRWGRTGEGEGGAIGIECAVARDAQGGVVGARSGILMDFNCGGMFRAWIDDAGNPVMSIWTNGGPDEVTASKQHVLH